MKRFLTVCMALLFAANAFAQEAKTEEKKPVFNYSVWANAFSVSETTAVKDEVKEYSNIRIRPAFTLTNENVSVVTRFEIDQYFGGKDTSKTLTDSNGDEVEVDLGKNGNSYAGYGGDNYAVEVKHVYIDVKDVFMPGLGLKAGLAGYKYPIAVDADVALFNVNFDAGMAKIDLAYIKATEENIKDTDSAGEEAKDDSQMYAAKVALNLGDITITPAMLYAVGEENAGDFALMMPALSFGMKQGALSVDADFVYVTGDDDKTNEVEASAYAANLNVGFKASDTFKVNLFGMYATGEDDDAETTTSFNSATFGDMEVGPMFIINDAGRINQVGISNEYDKATEGLMMFGLSAEFKMDKLTVLGQVAYAMTASDKGTNKETAIGTELNLRLAYEVAPKTSLWAEGAYLAAGKYVEAANGGENDKPMYYAAGLMTSF